MASVRSAAGFLAVLCATTCGAFVIPGPTQPKDFRSPSALSVSSKVFARNALGNRVNEASTIGGVRLEKNVRGKRPVATLKAASVDEGGEGGEGKDLSGLRRAALLLIWLPFVVYAFGPWSPGSAGDPKDLELATSLYDGSSGGPETALFSGVFNGLGVLPAVFASLLCGGGAFAKGRQPVPPQPFVFGAFGLGFFALAPYLALRNYLPEMEEGEDPTFLENWLTSKFTALPLLAGAAYCFSVIASSIADPAALSAFSELFWSSKLAHISTLDALVLSVAVVDPIREDMRRRGVEPEVAKVALYALPLLGPALWLVVRPDVVRE